MDPQTPPIPPIEQKTSRLGAAILTLLLVVVLGAAVYYYFSVMEGYSATPANVEGSQPSELGAETDLYNSVDINPFQ